MGLAVSQRRAVTERADRRPDRACKGVILDELRGWHRSHASTRSGVETQGLTSGASGAISDLPVSLASPFDEPEDRTSPEELIAAAHAGCFAMAPGTNVASQNNLIYVPQLMITEDPA